MKITKNASCCTHLVDTIYRYVLLLQQLVNLLQRLPRNHITWSGQWHFYSNILDCFADEKKKYCF